MEPKRKTVIGSLNGAVIMAAQAVEETAKVAYSAAFLVNTLVSAGQVYADNYVQSAQLEGQAEHARLLKQAALENIDLDAPPEAETEPKVPPAPIAV